jgi:hypothetical protein
MEGEISALVGSDRTTPPLLASLDGVSNFAQIASNSRVRVSGPRAAPEWTENLGVIDLTTAGRQEAVPLSAGCVKNRTAYADPYDTVRVRTWLVFS